VTGSVAAFKALDLLRELARTGAAVDATLTRAARGFVAPLSFQALGAARVHTEMFPAGPDGHGGALPDGELYGHLAPGQSADAMVVAPATANILASWRTAWPTTCCPARPWPSPAPWSWPRP
jgi:phosphopantothenoylcysteine decarboxylase/phosphopantothenate--cysteine ligase